jgi:FdrA protein
VSGTDEDPQNMAEQIEQLKQAGARVETNNEVAVGYIGQRLQSLNNPGGLLPVNLSALQQPLAAINVGLESFAASLTAQEAPVIHVNWKPPAGGNEKLMSILERMKQR